MKSATINKKLAAQRKEAKAKDKKAAKLAELHGKKHDPLMVGEEDED